MWQGLCRSGRECAHLAMDLSQFKHCLVSKATVSLACPLSRAEVYPCNNSSFITDLPGFTVCDGCLSLRSLSSLHVAQSVVLAPNVGYNTPHEWRAPVGECLTLLPTCLCMPRAPQSHSALPMWFHRSHGSANQLLWGWNRHHATSGDAGCPMTVHS